MKLIEIISPLPNILGMEMTIDEALEIADSDHGDLHDETLVQAIHTAVTMAAKEGEAFLLIRIEDDE